MSVTAPESRAEPASFELRATTFTLPTLRLFAGDLAALSQFLEPKIAQAPEFFRNAPVVVDLTHLPTEVALDFPLLVGVLRGLGMLPIGVRGGSAAHRETAQLMDLAILSQGSRGPAAAVAARAAPAVAAPASAAPAAAPVPVPAGVGKIVTRPVRSGQRIYAHGGDLVVLAAVSSGAELMADGHIHVYGALRGRALAGVKGNADARIFCSDLRAELVSVAGHYRVSEGLDPGLAGRPVQVALRDGRLIIEAL
ncbi:MAG: septum site-determining protein MinC [Gammaproteobacteria bacterium]|jgi:septum site-determining protein MinC|nr:septum site-determining protein MinC [Gammaproteobacteria bacterium]